MPSLGPDIVRRQVVIGTCVISPDGEWVVYTRRTVAGNAYRTNLWVVPFGGGRPRQLTSGAGNDTSPAFAPDGRTVAFVSDRGEGDDARLYLIRVDGGEAELVCGAPHGSVGQPAFSPDGRRIAFTGWAGEPRFWAGDPERKLARVIRTVDWRDDSGDRTYRTHLHVVAARPGARPRTVTAGDFDASEPAWHPDGTRIAFTTNRNPRGDLRPNTVIHEVTLATGAVHGLIGLRGTAGAPAWSPDGSTLAFVGSNVPGAPDYAEPQLYVWDGARRPRSLTGRLDLPVTFGWSSDLHDWLHGEIPAPRWDGDRALVVPVNRRGRDEVWRVPLRGEPQPLSQGDTTLGALTTAAGRVVATVTDDAYPPEVCAVEPDGLRRLTRHGGAWLRTHEPPGVREIDAGGVPSFLVEPPGARRRRTALVLSPHGGPYGAHGPTPELDSWLLAARGYRVLLPNIRGSCGYGADWIKPIQGRWGGPDADDLLTALDWTIAEGLADPNRVAALGLSYGGWAVNWLAGAAPDRFRAVVSENGVASMEAAHAVSCIGPGFDRDIGYGPAYQHRDAMWRSSPMRHVRRITAPVLMLQGEADRICPLDDTYQLFVALRELDRDVELVLYPDEHHVMMATARPDRRIDRFQRIADFLVKHCPP